MRITYLVEDSTRIWGGVKAVFDAANALHDRGHVVTVVSRSTRPQWMDLRCEFVQTEQFEASSIPHSDVLVATFWTTVPPALAANRGPVVHYCQGYEGDNPEMAAHRTNIERVYGLDTTHLVTISPNLRTLLRDKFGRDAKQVTYAIDHATMFAAEPRVATGKVRVALVGPYEIAWKDIRTGLEACQLAHQAGLELELVRITNTQPHPDEQDLGMPVEWHQNVPPAEMGALYRSCDVFLGTSRGAEEGFFLPAIEAMACGVPAVLTEIPCYQAYGEGQYALFVKPQSPQAMAEALVIAARHPDVRNELRTNGLRIAQRFRLDEHVSQLEAVFGEIAHVAATTPQSALNTQHSVGNAVGVLAATTRAVCDGCGTVARLDEIGNKLIATVRAELAHQRGLLEYENGNLQAARRSFEAALDGTAIPAEVYNDLGVACFGVGELDAARRAFEHALAIEPTHPDARANLKAIEGRRAGA
ncbi:MAG: glycosyltransferase [Planctomycetes bacterium]|nr:glycosyltransferase [Planctomycetota bacterium]